MPTPTIVQLSTQILQIQTPRGHIFLEETE